MDLSTIFTKTAKGIIDLRSGGRNLSPLFTATLQLVDGRSTVGAMLENQPQQGKLVVLDTLRALEAQNSIKVFSRAADNVEISKALPEDDSDYLPLIEIEELSAEEGVRAWAEARRGARELLQQGFMTTGLHGRETQPSPQLRLLIVEDDEAISTLMKTYLSRRGFSVQVVSDGLEALEVLDQAPAPNCVLLDVNLPNINGFDILAYIRDNERLRKLPAIMVTAQVSEADVLRGLKGGADGYIFKPFEWSALQNCIHQVLGIAPPA